jgi:hypothetical protein
MPDTEPAAHLNDRLDRVLARLQVLLWLMASACLCFAVFALGKS